MKIIIKRNRNKFPVTYAIGFILIGASIALAMKSSTACLEYLNIRKNITAMPDKIRKFIKTEIKNSIEQNKNKQNQKLTGLNMRVRGRKRNTPIGVNNQE